MYRENSGQITTRWEYRTLVSPDPTVDRETEQLLAAALNKLGVDGWEAVVSSSGANASLFVLLKRQVG